MKNPNTQKREEAEQSQSRSEKDEIIYFVLFFALKITTISAFSALFERY